MDNLQEIFGNIAKKLKLPKIYKYNLMELWEQVAGKIIANISCPEGVKDGVMSVVVQDPVWINQLHLIKNELIKRVNEIDSENSISDIRFKIGLPTNKIFKKPESANFNLDRIKLSEEDLNFIEELIKNVNDKELKELVRIFFSNAIRREYLCEKKAVK